nr:HAD hydrolase family protein [uncultured Solibaculum sp.]
MRVFASDLDNTLIYSYRRSIGKDTVLAERYEGREVSFMTKRSYEMLDQVYHSMTFIPVSTRSVQQYRRIRFHEKWEPSLALVSNGGTLLVDGQEDTKWKRESLALIKPAQEQLQIAALLLEQDEARTLDVRMVDDLFVFTKSDNVPDTITRLKDKLDSSQVHVWKNGNKVYVIPTALNKGEAIRRLKEKFQVDFVASAGDSLFDIPLLQQADLAFYPSNLSYPGRPGQICFSIDTEKILFSDAILEKLLQSCL